MDIVEAAKTVNVQASPLAQEIKAQIATALVVMEGVKFNFRTVDLPTGKMVEKEGKQVPETKEWKRPTFEVKLPLLTAAGLIAGLQTGDKTSELIREMANSAIIDRARGIINDAIEANPAIELSEGIFDINKLSLVAIANMPRSARGAGIPKEDFAAFTLDYKTIMLTPEAIAKFPDQKARTPETLEKHAIILGSKFNAVRSRKEIIEQMLAFLDIWVQVSPNAEEHQTVYEFLQQKGKTLLEGETYEDL